MEYLEKNLAVLQEFRPGIYSAVWDKLEKKEYSFELLETVETRDGDQALIISSEGKKVRLNSIYRPKQEAKKWADQYEFQNLSIVTLMFGMGNGIFVREMLKRLKDDAFVYLYEPDITTFLYVLHNYDMTDVFKDVRLMLTIEGINEEELIITYGRNIHWSMIPSQIFCEHPEYRNLYHDKYIWFQASIQKKVQNELANRDTAAFKAHSHTHNTIKNLHFVQKSNYVTDFIEDMKEEVPIIIVSAGPSLDKNIKELKKAAGKAFILATDTAVKYLLAQNIPFDAMITMDSTKSAKHLEDERCANIPLFCLLSSKSEILERHTGRKIWMPGNYYIEELYKKFHREFSPYNTGGSVATAAMMVGISLGFKYFILIGQDLAYGDGVTHAGNVTSHIVNEEQSVTMIEGINGEMVRSRYDWVIYRDWFEEAIKAKEEIEVVDATEGGALIHGTKVMTLAEAIDTYCHTEFHMREIIEGKPYTFDKKEYEEVRKEICHLEKDFNNIRQKSKEGKKAVADLSVKVNQGRSTPELEEKYLKQIRKANNFIEKQGAYTLFDSYISNSVTEAMQGINCITGDATKDFLSTLETAKIVFSALEKATVELGPILKDSLAKV